VFGQPGTAHGSDIGYDGSLCRNYGMGTVVGNKSTIITADHVYTKCLESQTTLWIQVNGSWVNYPVADLNSNVGPGDVRTIFLPSNLPGYVIPATMVANHSVVAGQSVTYVTYESIINDKGSLTGFTAISGTTTVAQDWTFRSPDYGNQVLLEITLISGSSGGGVFYNGQLIGVNSSADPSGGNRGTTMAPFCYTWFGSVC
jgi:hypothetical protein